MTQCQRVQYNLPFDAVYYQQSIFEQSFPPFLFCLTRSMSPKKRLLMFYDQNRFSKLLMIFSAIHNFSKLFRILALCDSHLLLFYFGMEWHLFSLLYMVSQKSNTTFFDFRPFFGDWSKINDFNLFWGGPVAPHACDVEHFAHLMRREYFAVVKICYVTWGI